nr:ribonuclease H-like domain-containing protein [Tanacetum cinerariifolium]
MIETNKEANRRYEASFAAHNASFTDLETHVDRLLDQLNKDETYEPQGITVLDFDDENEEQNEEFSLHSTNTMKYSTFVSCKDKEDVDDHNNSFEYLISPIKKHDKESVPIKVGEEVMEANTTPYLPTLEEPILSLIDDIRSKEDEEFLALSLYEDKCSNLLEEAEVTHIHLNPPQLPRVVINQVGVDDSVFKNEKEQDNKNFREVLNCDKLIKVASKKSCVKQVRSASSRRKRKRRKYAKVTYTGNVPSNHHDNEHLSTTTAISVPTADVYIAKKLATVEDLALMHKDKIYSELQAIVIHLEFMYVPIKQDDLNPKYLTSLAPEWLVYTIVWRNRDDLDTMSQDDVYNHLKVYEPEIQKRASDVAAASLSYDTIYHQEVKTERRERESYKKDFKVEEPAPKAMVAIDADEEKVPTKYALMAKSSSCSDNEIDDDDIKEMDIKWNLALLSMMADRFWKKTGKKITIQGSNITKKSRQREERESYKKDFKVEEPAPKAMVAIDADEEKVSTEYALMAKSSSCSDNEVYDDSFCSKSCTKNTENLNTKISKLNKELSDCETGLYNYKRGLSQVDARLVEFKENEIKYYEKIRVLERDIELKDNKIEYVRNELEEGVVFNEYCAVLPPPAQVYSPPKKVLSWMGLPEFVDDTVTDYTRPTPSIDVSKSLKSGFPNATKVNNTENARKPTVKYAKMYRNTSQSPRVRGNQRNWNNQKSQQLGKDFVMQNKACYNCGSFDHLEFNYNHDT